MEFLPRAFVTVRRIRLAAVWCALFAVFVILKMRFYPVFIFASGIVLLAGWGILPVYRRLFRFILTDGELEVSGGVFYHRTRKIPLRSVYSTERSQTPLEKLFKLSTVRVNGAGVSVKLPSLTKEQSRRFLIRLEGLLRNAFTR